MNQQNSFLILFSTIKMIKPLLWGILMLSSSLAALLKEEVELEHIPKSSLLFERKADVKFIQSYWKMGNVSNYQCEKYNLNSLKQSIDFIRNSCPLSEQECMKYNQQYEGLEQNFYETLSGCREVNDTLFRLDPKMDDRTAGFYRLQAIAHLSKDKNTKLQPYKKTITLESEVGKITDEVTRNDEKILDETRRLREMDRNKKGLVYTYNFTLDQAISAVNGKLSRALTDGKKVLETIRLAKNGMLSPSAATEKVFLYAVQEIERIEHPNKFLVKQGFKNLEELKDLIKITYGQRENILVLELDIPITNEKSVELY